MEKAGGEKSLPAEILGRAVQKIHLGTTSFELKP